MRNGMQPFRLIPLSSLCVALLLASAVATLVDREINMGSDTELIASARRITSRPWNLKSSVSESLMQI